jgi:hypothetical protein
MLVRTEGLMSDRIYAACLCQLEEVLHMHTDPEVSSHSLQIQPPMYIAALMRIHRLVHIILAMILQAHVRVKPSALASPQLQAGIQKL